MSYIVGKGKGEEGREYSLPGILPCKEKEGGREEGESKVGKTSVITLYTGGCGTITIAIRPQHNTTDHQRPAATQELQLPTQRPRQPIGTSTHLFVFIPSFFWPPWCPTHTQTHTPSPHPFPPLHRMRLSGSAFIGEPPRSVPGAR